MKWIILLLTCLISISCNSQNHKDTDAEDYIIEKDTYRAAHPKLLQLRRLPWGTHIDTLDLSNDGLREIPSLSMYFIKHINLAHNLIDSINVHRLPNGLHSIDLSYNRLKGRIDYWDASIHQQLRSINLSHNRITMFLTNAGSDWTLLDLSHNDLQCYCPPTEYHCHPPLRVDPSHNPRCSPLVLPICSKRYKGGASAPSISATRNIGKGMAQSQDTLDFSPHRDYQLNAKTSSSIERQKNPLAR